MSELKRMLSAVSLLPFAADGKFYDGLVKSQFKYCRDKCVPRDCLLLSSESPVHHVCSKGFSCYPLILGPQKLVLNGLIVAGKNTAMAGDRRAQYKQNVLTEEEVLRSIQSLDNAVKIYLDASNQGAKDSVAFPEVPVGNNAFDVVIPRIGKAK